MIIAALLFLLLASASVAASETVLFCLGRQSLDRLSQSGRAWGRRVRSVMEHPRRCLLTVLLANNVINVSIFTLSFVALEPIRQNHPEVAAVLGLLVLLSLIVLGEMLPKAVALAHAEQLAVLAAILVSALETVLAPIRWFLSNVFVDPIVRLLAPPTMPDKEVSREELRLLLEHSAKDGIIDTRENDMLIGVVGLSATKVREVMTPRVDLVSLTLRSDPEAVRRAVRNAGRTALLVCGRDLDEIHGVVHARDVYLNPRAPLRTLLRPAHFVPEQVNLLQLIRHFRSRRIRSAVVVDEYGGTAGLVSLVDVTQRIVGDGGLPEGSGPVSLESLDDRTFRVPGDFSVRVWADRFGVREIDGHIDTVAGLVLSKLGRLPKPGDVVKLRNLTLTVERMDRRRVATVLVGTDASNADQEQPK